MTCLLCIGLVLVAAYALVAVLTFIACVERGARFKAALVIAACWPALFTNGEGAPKS